MVDKYTGYIMCEIASSAEVKNKWSYTSTPLICLDGMDRESL
jgi:hypothetical protein